MTTNTQLRPLTRDNVPAVSKLLVTSRDALDAWFGFIPTEADIVRQSVDDPDFEHGLFIGAFAGDALRGCIMSTRRPWKEGRATTGFMKWLVVHPDHRRQGIGRALLASAETELASRGVDTLVFGSSAPLYLLPGVPQDDTATRELLKGCRWRESSRRINLWGHLAAGDMDRLARKEKAERKDGFTVAIAGKSDAVDVTSFIEKEFSHSWALEARPALRGAGDAFCSALREEETNRVVGFAAMHATNPNWFGPMGVEASLRGKGLGRWLVHHAMLRAVQQGTATVLLPWVNENAVFYRRVMGPLDEQAFIKTEKHLGC